MDKRVIGAVALLIGTAVIGAGATRLQSAFDPKQLVSANDKETQAADDLLRRFVPDGPELVLLLSGSDVFADENLQFVHQLSQTLMEKPWVASVESLSASRIGRLEEPERSLDSLEALEREEDNGEMESILLDLVESDPDTFPRGFASLGARLGAREFRSEPVGTGPEPLTDAQRTAMRALGELPALTRRLVSEDKRNMLVVLRTTPLTDEALMARVEGTLMALQVPDGTTVRVVGLPALRFVLGQRLQGDLLLLVVASCILSVLVLVLGFRNGALVGLSMGSVGITMGLVTGSMGWLGIPLTLLTNIVPPLLVTLGLGDAVHLLVHYQRERQKPEHGGDGAKALRFTLRSMWRACFVTSVTTAVGFASLVVSSTPALREFALLASLAVMVAFAVTVLALPLLLSIVPLPAVPLTARAERPQTRRFNRGILRLTAFSVRHAAAMVALSLVVLASTMGFSTQLSTDAPLFDQLDEDEPIRQATQILEQDFGGVRRLELLWARGDGGSFRRQEDFASLANFETWLREQPAVLQADGPAQLVSSGWNLIRGAAEDVDRDATLATSRQAWGSKTRLEALFKLLGASKEGDSPQPAGCVLCRFLSEDGTTARITVRLQDAPVGQLDGLLRAIEEQAHMVPGSRLVMTGEAKMSTEGLHQVLEDLFTSLPIALVVILVVISLLFRSPRLGLIAILPNIIPLTCVLAYMALRAIPLHASTLIVLPVTFGLVVDGTIHLLAHFQNHGTGSAALRVMRTFQGSGRAVILASATLLAGFAALALSSFRPIQLFAELSAVAIFAALVAELTLVPALLVLFGNRPSAS